MARLSLSLSLSLSPATSAMAYGRSKQSLSDNLCLSPLPYPVVLILLMVLLLLGVTWSFTYEDIIETAEEQMSWALLATPVILLLAIRWLSSIQSSDDVLFGLYRYDPRRRSYPGRPQEGSSPWGVAAAVVLLLIMVSFKSTFLDMWKP